MAAIYSNGGNRWNILGFNFTKRDALSSVYKISMLPQGNWITLLYIYLVLKFACTSKTNNNLFLPIRFKIACSDACEHFLREFNNFLFYISFRRIAIFQNCRFLVGALCKIRSK
jgi:hypothetical protein